VNAFEDGLAARAAWARDVALFRYGMIRAAADPDLSPQQRGELVRALAAGEHKGPDGRPVRLGRSTLDRWIRDWRAGGFDALVPGGRQVSPRTGAGVLELAVALKKEKPDRSAAQVHRILAMRMPGQVPTARTIQRHFVRMELTGLAGTETAPETFGRFEASAPGELWLSDVLHGPRLGAGKSYLFGIEDDHSRFITGHWWTTREDTLGLFAALRRAVEAHGAPKIFYVDNGSPYVSRQLLHALAVLGIQITRSRPRRPQGKGKIERLFETVRCQFLVEVTAAGQAGTVLESVTDLEELFGAWVHQVYHQAVHGETGQAPAGRFAAGPSRLRQLAPEAIDEAFLWQDFRTVTKTATVSLHGNRYEADPALCGRKAELLYNPLDLTCGIRIRYRGTEMGTAIPHVIGRHSHPQASPAAPAPAPPTGIDYLRMIAGQHRAGQAAAINFRALTGGQDQDAPGEPR
jgi:transposase InsO family protein